MKIKTYQKLKLLLLATGCLSANLISHIGTLTETELIKIFNDQSITIKDIDNVIMFLTNIFSINSHRFESYTTEYKEIKKIYQDILQNSKDLFKILEVDQDPIETFALYAYLYRKGYLSYQHKFVFDNNTKDFSKLFGVDVILGHGVCRSISSMFVDICHEIGMDAQNVYVKVNDNQWENPKLLSIPSMEIEGEQQHSEILEKIIQLLPLGNHVVSAVSSSKKKSIYIRSN